MFGLRERKRIYKNTVDIIAQTITLKEQLPTIGSTKRESEKDKAVKKQLAKSMEIIMITLGYHEGAEFTEKDEPLKVYLPEDNNREYGINKEKLEEVLIQLPTNKDFKEALWKSCVKRDAKASELLRTILS